MSCYPYAATNAANAANATAKEAVSETKALRRELKAMAKTQLDMLDVIRAMGREITAMREELSPKTFSKLDIRPDVAVTPKTKP